MDGNNGEGARPSLLETQTPALQYNRALLEAFQRSAEKYKLPENHVDTTHQVVCIGGSLGKGVGHFGSDLDVVVAADKDIDEDLFNFPNSIEQELEALTRPGMPYEEVSNYISLAQQIREKHDARALDASKKVREGVMSHNDAQKIEDRQYQRAPGLLLKSMRVIPAPQILEHQELFPDGLGRDEYAISTDEVVGELSEGKMRVENERGLFLILSSTLGVNAYELTPGNLDHQQQKVVKALRELHTTSPKQYAEVLSTLRSGWKEYTERIGKKYPQYVKELRKNRGENIYLMHDFFTFQEFPDIQDLETFFQKTGEEASQT